MAFLVSYDSFEYPMFCVSRQQMWFETVSTLSTAQGRVPCQTMAVQLQTRAPSAAGIAVAPATRHVHHPCDSSRPSGIHLGRTHVRASRVVIDDVAGKRGRYVISLYNSRPLVSTHLIPFT